jgi:hypothetical protein
LLLLLLLLPLLLQLLLLLLLLLPPPLPLLLPLLLRTSASFLRMMVPTGTLMYRSLPSAPSRKEPWPADITYNMTSCCQQA